MQPAPRVTALSTVLSPDQVTISEKEQMVRRSGHIRLATARCYFIPSLYVRYLHVLRAADTWRERQMQCSRLDLTSGQRRLQSYQWMQVGTGRLEANQRPHLPPSTD